MAKTADQIMRGATDHGYWPLGAVADEQGFLRETFDLEKGEWHAMGMFLFSGPMIMFFDAKRIRLAGDGRRYISSFSPFVTQFGFHAVQADAESPWKVVVFGFGQAMKEHEQEALQVWYERFMNS